MDNLSERKGSAVLRDLSLLKREEVAPIEYVLTDVDDTITSKGKLLPVALQALWDLAGHGFKVICVTGGSAGWGDAYLRQWPVEAVVCESGAVSLYREDGKIRQFVHPSIVTEGYGERRRRLVEAVQAQVPDARLSTDQFARMFDIAFDHGSEPPYLSDRQISRIVSVCEKQGAQTAVSSIHVNAWFGSYDKLEGTRMFFSEVLGMGEEQFRSKCTYCGDAPNDQEMFGYFPLTFGVADILERKDRFETFPAYLAQGYGGEGFSRIATALNGTKTQ
jgi:HAD superfamily hydrolase (TIGR01484 family)